MAQAHACYSLQLSTQVGLLVDQTMPSRDSMITAVSSLLAALCISGYGEESTALEDAVSGQRAEFDSCPKNEKNQLVTTSHIPSLRGFFIADNNFE